MKKTKIFGLLAGLSMLVLLTGCTKDMVTRMNSIPITFERFNGDGKAYIDDIYACWEDGDQIKITRKGGTTTHYSGTISISYPSGVPVASATASGFETATGDSVYVAYPRDLFGGGTVFEVGHDMEILLPSIYEYVTTNGKQKIVSPMVGRVTIESFGSDEENPNVLRLTNLCCLLKIQLSKPSLGSFVLDSIKVINKTKTTPMSGSAQISFGSGTPVLSMEGSVNKNTVVLDLKANAVAINETKYFYVPIPPQASGQNFEVKIHNKLTGHWKTSQIYTNRSIPGNSVAQISGPSTNDDTPYTFYDYLMNNTGSSKIDLGVTPNNNMKMEITFSVPTGYMSGSQYYTGSRPGDANTQIYFGLSASGNDTKFRAHFCSYPQGNETGANYVMSTMDREPNVKYRQTIEVKPDTTAGHSGWYYAAVTFERLDGDGNTVAIETHNTGSKEGGIPAGATHINVFSLGQVYQPQMKLYSYRIWSGSTLLHNFVPAKDNNTSQYGVYDMVTGGGFVTGTTGSFTAGNDTRSK